MGEKSYFKIIVSINIVINSNNCLKKSTWPEYLFLKN
jgi:hypothetical protein